MKLASVRVTFPSPLPNPTLPSLLALCTPPPRFRFPRLICRTTSVHSPHNLLHARMTLPAARLQTVHQLSPSPPTPTAHPPR